MKTFFFYDLETSGFSPRDQRIMQFAGIRTTMDLEPVGEPVNVLVTLSDDILPDPGAVVVTGITPQQTKSEGISEPELSKLLLSEVFTPDTITVGFNSVRFDDEFIRHTLWRDFYDPYEWAWSEGRSRWDMLDVVRMTRALRPEGIEWSVSDEGKPVNKLEMIAKANGLLHTKAHDALSDVEALIGVARLIKQKQPKLFGYLLKMRDKKEVEKLVSLKDPQPFVYTSGRYAQHESTTVAVPIAAGPTPNSLLVYDLRYDPSEFFGASPSALASVMFADREARQEKSFTPLPVKQLTTNKCPAIAPMGVLDDDSRARLEIDLDTIKKHWDLLQAHPEFAEAVKTAFEMREPYAQNSDVESQLYDGFGSDKDKTKSVAVRAASASELSSLQLTFEDRRLNELLIRYKGRYFSETLTDEEREKWEAYKTAKLQAQLPGYLDTLHKLALARADSFLLEELQLWAESIAPLES